MSVALLATATVRPPLHLSGAKLRAAFEAAVRAAEPVGGVESFVAALKLKSQVFEERLGGGRVGDLTLAAFDEIRPLMATVRRRIGPLIAERGWSRVHRAIAALLDNATVPGTADQRITAFETALSLGSSPPPLRGRVRVGGSEDTNDHVTPPTPKPSPQGGVGQISRTSAACAPRFLRDLAAEILHGVHPEHYPLMTRWMWDARANTGVLREIWHDAASGSDAVDQVLIDIPDTHETFLALREELSQFLSGNGIFRDMIWYVDLLCAQVYAGYIDAQGGAWLKTDFSAEGDPLEHTRRILGLDGVGLRNGVRPRTAMPEKTSAIGGAGSDPVAR